MGLPISSGSTFAGSLYTGHSGNRVDQLASSPTAQQIVIGGGGMGNPL